jgi:hypothetical protein
VEAACGRRGLYEGRLYVPDLQTALQLASRRGGVIQLSPGDYFPPVDKGYFDVRLAGTTVSNDVRRLVIFGSSPGTLNSFARQFRSGLWIRIDLNPDPEF